MGCCTICHTTICHVMCWFLLANYKRRGLHGKTYASGHNSGNISNSTSLFLEINKGISPEELEVEKLLEVEQLRASVDDFFIRLLCANLAFTTSWPQQNIFKCTQSHVFTKLTSDFQCKKQKSTDKKNTQKGETAFTITVHHKNFSCLQTF